MSEEKCLVSLDTAISMLPDDDRIHTFRSAGFCIIGCDLDRNSLLDRMRRFEESLEIGGSACQSMNHGLVLTDDEGALFIECRKGTDYEEIERESSRCGAEE